MYCKSRKEAIEKGEPRYYTGKHCRHRHIAARYTRSGACTACTGSTHNFKTRMALTKLPGCGHPVQVKVMNYDDIPLIRDFVAFVNSYQTTDDESVGYILKQFGDTIRSHKAANELWKQIEALRDE